MNRGIVFVKKILPRKFFLSLQPPYHFLLAFFGALRYRFPSRHLAVIGVTGTKGKTTVVELLHAICAASGAKTASLSSLRFKIGETETKNELKMTMPGRFFIQRFLHDAKKAGCKYAILEVTSEGIKQFRHRFIGFDVVVMTNIAPEHIEAHGSFEKYFRAKLDLFWRLRPEGLAIINRDDPSSPRFSAATAAHKLFYQKERIEFGKNIWQVREMVAGEGGISFSLNEQEFHSPLLGGFNFFNALAAVAVGLSQHIPPERIARALAGVSGIPGRMEFIQREPFAVVIDYAHTPDSLKSVYMFLKECQMPKVEGHKLICVLGAAGGGRDKWKRPAMGRIAAEICDEIILTNEDSYDEDPQQILSEIKSGVTSDKRQMTREIIDRKEAIREALKAARAGDMVVITGKGAEPWIMGPDGKRTSWNEREVVREELGLLK